MDPTVIAALITAWASIMVPVVAGFRRMNGSGPLSKKLDVMDARHAERFARLETRMVSVEERTGRVEGVLVGAARQRRRQRGDSGPSRSA